MHEIAGELPQLKVAIVLVASLDAGAAANVSACVAAGLAASKPDWAGCPLQDAAGLRSVASSHLPISVLRADAATMRALLKRMEELVPEPGAAVSLFPAYAQTIHSCTDYWDRHGVSVHKDEDLLGLGIRGPKKWVNRLTGSLALWR